MKVKNLETQINEIDNLAKEKLKNGDNIGAERLIMKRIKVTEQVKQLEGAMTMMEEQKMMLESVSQMKDVMNAIKQNSCTLKEASKGMSIEDYDKLKEDIDEINPNQEELNDFFKEYANEDNNKELVSDIMKQLKDEINGTKKEKVEIKEYMI